MKTKRGLAKTIAMVIVTLSFIGTYNLSAEGGACTGPTEYTQDGSPYCTCRNTTPCSDLFGCESTTNSGNSGGGGTKEKQQEVREDSPSPMTFSDIINIIGIIVSVTSMI